MYVCACGSNHTWDFWANVFDDFRGDVAERAGERGELLVGRIKEFSL